MNLAALLRVFTRDLYEFDLYDLFLERISRTNRGIPVPKYVRYDLRMTSIFNLKNKTETAF